MEKKKVRAKVINGNLEIKKYKIRKRASDVKKYFKNNWESYAKCFAFGAGIATIYFIREELL